MAVLVIFPNMLQTIIKNTSEMKSLSCIPNRTSGTVMELSAMLVDRIIYKKLVYFVK